MSFTVNSELDKSANLSADDFIKAFDLNNTLSRAIKYIVRYSQHKNTEAGAKNLQKAIDELKIEQKFNQVHKWGNYAFRWRVNCWS